MKNALLKKYAGVKEQIAALEAELEKMKPEVIEEVVATGEPTLDTEFGSFTVSNLKTWTYTPKVTKAADALKALKAKEELTGVATFVEKQSLRYSA